MFLDGGLNAVFGHPFHAEHDPLQASMPCSMVALA